MMVPTRVKLQALTTRTANLVMIPHHHHSHLIH